MKITEVCLRRPVTTTICTLALVIFGLLALRGMGVQRIPDVDFPVVAVSTTMTGANATVMDHDVTDVLEEKLSSISGIESLSSSSYQGQAVTVIEFGLDRDIDAAAADVRDKVNQALGDLPDEAETPVVEKFTTSDSSLVTIAVLGAASYREKSFFVDKVLKARLQAVNGVGNVETPGLRKREIRIWLDPAKLEARGLTVSDISDALEDKHVELPAGSVKTGRQDLELRLTGEYGTVEELASLPVDVREGRVIRLRDLARVEDGFEERESGAAFNGNEALFVSVGKQRGANEVAVADAVIEKLAEVQKEAPKGVGLKVISNESDYVRRSIEGVGTNVMQAVLLCSLIMLFFLQTFRATFVAIVTIPVCLLGSFLFMRAMGLTVNNLTMMGITLAVGMVVDATTVVLENVHRHMEEGMGALSASQLGTDEVAFSVMGGALTTVAVFAPVAYMGGIVGKFFYSFGITVVCTILLSLMLSLSLTPFLCSRILRKDHPGPIARRVEALLKGLERAYRAGLGRAVRFRWITLGIALGLFVLGLAMASRIGTGFFPNDDQGEFSVSVEMPQGTALEETDRVLRRMDALVRKDPAVRYTFSESGTGNGNEANRGELYVELVPRKQRPPVTEVMNRLRRELASFRDARITLDTGHGSDVTMTLVGGTPEELVALADRVLADLRASGRFRDLDTDVRLNKPQLDIVLDRARTDDMNLNVRDLSKEVRAYFGGTKAGVFKEEGFRYDIRLMADRDLRSSPEDVERIALRNGAGQIVRIPGLVTVKRTLGPSVVKRYARQNSLQISANVAEGFSSGEAMTLVDQTVRKNLAGNDKIHALATGRSKHQKEDFHRLFVALAIAITLVYVVMAVQFESFLHPFTVMFSLPLLTPGAFGLLLLAGNDLDMMSFMGIILLVGIVVNNGIILVDFINQARARGTDKVQAALEAGPLRLRPILMTAVSTLVGSIPTALALGEGGELRQPMGVAVVGGLFTSTLLTLFVIPVVYLVLDDARDRLGALRRRLRGRRAVPGEAPAGGR
jgi:HAE1 family hydrophobic/amphiphilic exporter-1